MRVFATCVQCWQKKGAPTSESFTVHYYDDRVAYVTCSQGHRSALLIQSPKFEVLLESGAGALIDGYTMEAAASFSAALERFFEFCVQVFCETRKLSQDIYDLMFKEMARQSERQIGAFLVLHALELGIPYKLNQDIPTFRNGVIHKGQIPTPESAKDFCRKVYKEILTVSKTLLEKFPDAYNEVIRRDLSSRSSKLPEDMPRATSTGTVFFMAREEDFDDALMNFARGRQAMELAPSLIKMFSNLIASKGSPQPSAVPNATPEDKH
ncbi:hypothetical protein ACFPT7_16795 [Acidicapsa dinghuensis]|uniref:BTB domain-containing protein n=1 Tax=Acidicapsa dinghuensis TaxID=2218256 RepID=A0ABW1EL31_9BACT|nr:hypothetical protein [Acidicapsa dinghuensis]